MTSTRITPADFCNGHGGECDAYDPEMGCMHDDPHFDHGVTSHCDGTCQAARDGWDEYLDQNVLYRPEAYRDDMAVLDVSGHGSTPASFRVTFVGQNLEARILAFMDAHPGYYVDELATAPLSRTFTALLARLYPTCGHGMSAHLCEGPEHWMSADQERAMGW